jgi:hypothetical protein
MQENRPATPFSDTVSIGSKLTADLSPVATKGFSMRDVILHDLREQPVQLKRDMKEMHVSKRDQPPEAFSESSILFGCASGMISRSEHKILRDIAASKDKVEAYCRLHPTLLLKDSASCASFSMPSLDESTSARLVLGEHEYAPT